MQDQCAWSGPCDLGGYSATRRTAGLSSSAWTACAALSDPGVWRGGPERDLLSPDFEARMKEPADKEESATVMLLAAQRVRA
jgi:hypothetical protein